MSYRSRDPRPETQDPKPAGYILFEALVALTLLSIGVIGINRAIRETIQVRGMTRDYTEARFLLEQVIANLELQPQLIEGSGDGSFENPHERFHWKWEVAKVDVPLPPIPPDTPPDVAEKFRLNDKYLTKITATVSWKRGGQSFEETAQTLWRKDKLFIPKEQQQ